MLAATPGFNRRGTGEVDLTSCADVLTEAGHLSGQHLIIHGRLEGDAIDWRHEVWNGDELAEL